VLSRRSGFARLLAKPAGLAGSRWELPAATLCCTVLAAVFIAELLTPDDIVGALALLPLLAGLWLLSNRLAFAVALLTLVLFAAEVLMESANRLTVISVGGTIFVIAIAARLYAISLADLLSVDARQRPLGVPAGQRPGEAKQLLERAASLSRRELDVARLAAQGYTAIEVGQRLHISERTVESHLASTYAKLGIKSKRELIRMSPWFAVSPTQYRDAGA